MRRTHWQALEVESQGLEYRGQLVPRQRTPKTLDTPETPMGFMGLPARLAGKEPLSASGIP